MDEGERYCVSQNCILFDTSVDENVCSGEGEGKCGQGGGKGGGFWGVKGFVDT